VFSHVMVGANDLEASKKSYDVVRYHVRGPAGHAGKQDLPRAAGDETLVVEERGMP
jgi:hypothetical protein